jgi:hypothetical protein
MVRLGDHADHREVVALRVLDFTLCTQEGHPFNLSSDRSVMLAAGTLNYLPGRLFRDDQVATAAKRLDVYSIAVMAYEYACFTVPQGNQYRPLSDQLRNPTYQSLDALLNRCWAEEVLDCRELLSEVKGLEGVAPSAEVAPVAEKPSDTGSARVNPPPSQANAAPALLRDGNAKLQEGLIEDACHCFEQVGLLGDLRGYARLAYTLWRTDPQRAIDACDRGYTAFREADTRSPSDAEALKQIRVAKALAERDLQSLSHLCPADANATDLLRTGQCYARLLPTFDVLEDTAPAWDASVKQGGWGASPLPRKIRHRDSGISLLLVPPDVRGRSDGFYLGESVVSQFEWRAAGWPLPDGIARLGDDLPVHGVSWSEASDFAGALGFRLPTGVEWDLAARGGESDREVRGIGPQVANIRFGAHDTAPDGMMPASALKPSPSGFRQMFGNIWEWCQDSEFPGSNNRLRRGGCYKSSLEECLSRQPSFLDMSRRAYSLIGFRVAFSPP